MEPVDIMKKEKEVLKCLGEMRRQIYTPIAELKVEAALSKEPVPWEERKNLSYGKLPKNGKWAGLFDCAWFHIQGKVPETAGGKHVVAHIDIGGEGLVYFHEGNKVPVGAVTLDTSFIDRLQACEAKTLVEIGSSVKGGETIDFDVDAGFNGYYNHPVGNGYFKCARLCTVDDGLLEYYYDYLTVATLMCSEKDEEKKKEIKTVLEKSFKEKDGSLERGRKLLEIYLKAKPDSSMEFTAIGHSHLDLAWLWPLRETKRKASRTFTHQIANMKRYPDYIYGASQPQQFEFVRESHPEVYRELQQFAKKGQLECQGAMWVEADMNVPSGESLIRQIIYGKRFFREEFGQEMNVCWLPDVFGYNGNLPQILKKSGVPYFLTIKLSWNEHNAFPNRSFRWTGIDGSEVLTHMPPAETYNAAASPACVRFAMDHYPEREISHHAVMLYGIGDGGGGPSEAHIEMAQRQRTLEGSPLMKFGTSKEFFQELEQEKEGLPEYFGELYLEKHQGTYTTQAFNKKSNRRSEYGLQDLETLCCMAAMKKVDYPGELLERLWKKVLLLQFHDILPGSSIQRVYTESREDYLQIDAEIQEQKKRALDELKLEEEGYSAYNPTSFERKVYIKEDEQWLTGNLPSLGMGRLEPWDGKTTVSYTENSMENELVKVCFGEDGSISALTDKKIGWNYAGDYMNRLTLYEDEYLEYNAWDIDWEYYKKPYLVLKPEKTEIFMDGPAAVQRSVYRHNETEIYQEIRLNPGSAILQFHTTCQWKERLHMLRAEFAPSVYSDKVKCDIQLGALMRSTREDTPQEKAQFEICAHKYVDVSDGKRGISLMNDCKYGHRVKNGMLSLNLLRSTIYPDPEADLGEQEFTYALLIHEGDCDEETVKESYFLNKAPIAVAGVLPDMSIASSSASNVVIETIKQAENGTGIVVRAYEAVGRPAETEITLGFAHKQIWECDLEETKTERARLEKVFFKPFEIKTFLVEY